MPSLESLLPLVHFFGLALAVGSATVKLLLLFKSRSDPALLPAYFATVKPITRLIALGTALLILSGLTWLILGYPFTDLLIVKLVLVGAIVGLGATIDNFVEPRFRKLVPVPGQSASRECIRMHRWYLLAEAAATGMYYVVIVIWTLR